MVEVTSHWVGFLCNVDSSILALKLPADFEMKYFSEDDVVEHLLSLNRISDKSDFYSKFWINFRCFNDNEKRLYYVHREELLEVELTENGEINRLPQGESERLYNDIIRKLFRLIRLLGEGDIRIPYDYVYYELDVGIRSHISRYTTSHISRNMFHFKEDYLEELRKLDIIEFPFKKAFLKLAFDNYEDSYEAQSPVLSFLSLMIAMEALFNPGQSELRHRISRNCAVLLGNTMEESLEIYTKIRDIYDTRSKIIHTGDQSDFNAERITILRHYIRESIKKMLEINESKNVILRKLNTLGFGEISKYILN